MVAKSSESFKGNITQKRRKRTSARCWWLILQLEACSKHQIGFGPLGKILDKKVFPISLAVLGHPHELPPWQANEKRNRITRMNLCDKWAYIRIREPNNGSFPFGLKTHCSDLQATEHFTHLCIAAIRRRVCWKNHFANSAQQSN